MANEIWEKVGFAQFMPASAILELLHDPFTELFYRAFEQYWRKLRPVFFARKQLLCHALDRSDLCSDPCDPAPLFEKKLQAKSFLSFMEK
jgi:hypothetical protein